MLVQIVKSKIPSWAAHPLRRNYRKPRLIATGKQAGSPPTAIGMEVALERQRRVSFYLESTNLIEEADVL